MSNIYNTPPKAAQLELYYWGLIPSYANTAITTPETIILPTMEIKKISGRDMRSIILTKSGDVHIQDEINSFNNPNRILLRERAILSDIFIMVSTGIDHILALTSQGNVYSWGTGYNGQLGFAECSVIKNPRKMENLSNIVSIGCGNEHSVAITNNGEIFCFGRSIACGLSTKYNISVPKLIKKIEKNEKYKISAGLDFTIVLLKNTGILYSWGSGNVGQCGTGTKARVIGITKILTLFTEDKKNMIKQISCGQYHCLALSFSGDIYCWGDDEYGQLGLNQILIDQKQTEVPFKINHENKFSKAILCFNSRFVQVISTVLQ